MKYPTELKLMVLIVISVAFGGIASMTLHKNFSSPPPELGLSAHAEAPVLISCQELQRELNRRHPKLKLKVDGKCGPATMAAWDAEVNTQYALKLWPEDAK